MKASRRNKSNMKKLLIFLKKLNGIKKIKL